MQPTVGLPTEPVLLSPQQLPGYPDSPPPYSLLPSSYSNEPPQPTQSEFSRQHETQRSVVHAGQVPVTATVSLVCFVDICQFELTFI